LRVWLLVLPFVAAGCAFDDGISVHISGSSPVRIVESFSAQVSVRHVRGVTVRARQIVRMDCPITIIYDVNEATGSAVLAQTYTVHLRTGRLRRGTRYDIDCSDPVVLELPSDATNVVATATSGAGDRTPLPVGDANGMRADRETQLVSIGWPDALPAGDYRLELDFNVSDARAFREKAVYAASITCGRMRYLLALLPAATSLAHVPAFGVDPAAGPATIFLPHIVAANGLRAGVTRRLRC
jgi:hypothetical protein